MKNIIIKALVVIMLGMAAFGFYRINSLDRQLLASRQEATILEGNLGIVKGENASYARLVRTLEKHNQDNEQMIRELKANPIIVEHTVYITKPVTNTLVIKDNKVEDLFIKGEIKGREFSYLLKKHLYEVTRLEFKDRVDYFIVDKTIKDYAAGLPSGEVRTYYEDLSRVTVLSIVRAKKKIPWTWISIGGVSLLVGVYLLGSL